MSESVMTCRQASELDHALARCGLTPADVKWLCNGDRLAEVLLFVRGTHEIKQKVFPIWKTVVLEPLTDAAGSKKTLEEARYEVDRSACSLIDYISRSSNCTERITSDLVRLSVSEMGFPNGARTVEVYTRAKMLGLELCRPDLGIWLRHQYSDQTQNETLCVGMDPISEPGHHPYVFCIINNGGSLSLSVASGLESWSWGANTQWLFSQP